ncbi:hypothetical protein AHAS_Ahas19G0108200 [Arachis hypogaea]
MSPAIEKKTLPVKETEMAAESQITGEDIDEEQEIRDNAGCACKLLKEKEMTVMVVEAAKKKKNGSSEWC